MCANTSEYMGALMMIPQHRSTLFNDFKNFDSPEMSPYAGMLRFQAPFAGLLLANQIIIKLHHIQALCHDQYASQWFEDFLIDN